MEECGPCPVFAGYTMAFALQLRKEHGKTSFRDAWAPELGWMLWRRESLGAAGKPIAL
jgi:hypothetical protein